MLVVPNATSDRWPTYALERFAAHTGRCGHQFGLGASRGQDTNETREEGACRQGGQTKEGSRRAEIVGQVGATAAAPEPHLAREQLPIPDPKHVGLTTYDAKDPNTKYPPITDAAAAEGRAERADRADRRRRLRRVVGVRRAVQHAGGRAAGGGWAEAQPLSHHRAVLADPPGAADRTQPPLRRHGRDHRDGHLGAGQQQHPAQGEGADRRNPEAQRLFDRAVRQVPRGAGVGGLARRARSTSGRPVRASSTSTASSAARPTSTTRACTRAPRRSSRRSRPRRATRSPRISPTAPSPGCVSRRR